MTDSLSSELHEKLELLFATKNGGDFLGGFYIHKVFIFIFQEFSSLRLEMNAACEGWPSLIVLPTSDSDVSLALRAARTAGLPVRQNVVKNPNAIKISMNNSTKSACF